MDWSNINIIFSFEFAKEWLRITSVLFGLLQPIVTVAAIAIGAWWFIFRGMHKPRAIIKHSVIFKKLKKRTYIGVTINIKNTGNVPIKPNNKSNPPSAVVIEELAPFLDKEQVLQINSPEYKLEHLGMLYFPSTGFVIEPSEDQSFLFEFLIQHTTKTIKVYSHLDNTGYNNNCGWDLTTIHEVSTI